MFEWYFQTKSVANRTSLVSTDGQILSLYPFSFTSWIRSMSMCVWDKFFEDRVDFF